MSEMKKAYNQFGEIHKKFNQYEEPHAGYFEDMHKQIYASYVKEMGEAHVSSFWKGPDVSLKDIVNKQIQEQIKEQVHEQMLAQMNEGFFDNEPESEVEVKTEEEQVKDLIKKKAKRVKCCICGGSVGLRNTQCGIDTWFFACNVNSNHQMWAHYNATEGDHQKHLTPAGTWRWYLKAHDTGIAGATEVVKDLLWSAFLGELKAREDYGKVQEQKIKELVDMQELVKSLQLSMPPVIVPVAEVLPEPRSAWGKMIKEKLKKMS